MYEVNYVWNEMHMSAEPSPLHDMTQGIMYSMAVTVMYPLMHYTCVAC